MSNRNKYVFDRFSSATMGQDTEDLALSENIYSYMKAMADIDEVRNDPSFNLVMSETAGLVNKHYDRVPGKQAINDLNFIKESLSEPLDKESVSSELEMLRTEAAANGVYEETQGWVSDFYSRSDSEKDSAILEKKRFIAAALSSGEENKVEKEIKSSGTEEKRPAKRYIVRYISLSAAAVIAVMILIGSLGTSSNPGKIYSSFYEPYKAVPYITRGSDQSSTFFNEGVRLYNSGDYKGSQEAFSKMTAPSGISGQALLLLGLSNLENGNYGSAVNNFIGVINEAGEYSKDGKWYLGLLYLKTGETTKASELFESLSKSEGFYMKPSQKILRRLR
jgi:TolA-binding protein